MTLRAPGRVQSAAILLQRWPLLAVGSVLAAGAVLYCVRAESGAGSTELSISVHVPLVAAARVAHQQPTLAITDADVARGYVELVAASRLTIATTSRSGYMLEFRPRSAMFKSVRVSSPAGPVSFGSEGGTLVARGRGGSGLQAELSYRFELADDVLPGIHPWPLAIAVKPL